MNKKKIVCIVSGMGILVIALAVAAVLFFAGGYRIEFEGQFDDSLAFEYGQEADIPRAYVVNRYGVRQPQKVMYSFTSAEGEVTETEYPVAKCDSVGEWKVSCSSDRAEAEKSFQVVDTVAPVIEVGPLPSDVYVGNTETEYTVPGVNFKDASPIDYQNSSVELFFEGEPVTYNTLTQVFVPETWGEYTFKIKAADIYGNVATEECKWRSKDASWKDEEVPEGYLATYDSLGYTNLISAGFINEYWTGTETEEFLEEYQGEKGVVKVNMTYNKFSFTVAKIWLARTITPEQLGDRKIIIRYLVESPNTTGSLTLAGNYQEKQQSSVARYFDYTPGEWETAVIDAADLKNVSYVDEDGVLRSLQLGFRRNGGGATSSIYLASVTIAEKLDKPANLRVSGGKLHWDAVKDAEGYTLYADEQEIQLSSSELSYSLGDAKVFRLASKGDNLFKLDSDVSIYVNDTPKNGYLAEFDEAYYKYLVWNNGAGTEGGMEWYESDGFEASFDEKEKAVRLDLIQGYVTAGVVVRLPKAVSVDDLDSVVIRFKADENVKCVRIYRYGGEGLMLESAEIREGWNTLVIPKSLLMADKGSTSLFSGYQMMFYANAEPKNGKGQGTNMTVYLGSVTKAKQLEKPENLKLEGNTLTWDAVANASGYMVVEDGKSKTVKNNSYKTGGGEFFQVYALGDDLFYVNSDTAIYVNDSLPENYLAGFDKEYYKYLVWNNGAGTEGGMQWYESDSFEASFDRNEKAVKLNLTQGYVGAGIVVRLPESVSLSTLENVVIRFKADKNVKCVRIYQYGGNTRMLETTGIQEGWNTLVIPKALLLPDKDTKDQFGGYQMIFYANEKPKNGVGQGTDMTVYLGSVTNAEKLEKPENLKISGNTLTWDKVAGASGYEVIEDGKTSTVNTNAYTMKGGNLFKVAALGDGRTKVTSDYAIYVNATVPDGYIATFDKEFYEYLIWNDGAEAEGGMQWYESDSHKVTFEAATGTTRVDMTFGYVGAGSVVQFPKAVNLSEIDDMVVRIQVDSQVKAISFYQYGGTGRIYRTTELTPGWNTIIIPKKNLVADKGSTDTMSGMQIILYSNAEGKTGVKQGTATTMRLGTISSIRRLAAPENVRVEGTTLTWDAVEGAVSYVVYEDDVKYTSATNSMVLHGGELLKVQAIGDGKTTSDSDFTICVNGKVKEGYLAEFNKSWYDYLIWNNGADAPGGMQWYESAAFEAGCDVANQEMDVTAEFGYVCAGMVVKFPQGKVLETNKDVVVNIKLDENVKSVAFYPYGKSGNLLLTKDIKSGWNRIVIPKENLAAAVGAGTFEGLQIILYDNEEGKITQNSPAKTAQISIGRIHYAEALGKPVLTLEGTNVSWPAVANADSYEVYVNDELKSTQTATSYSVADLANGVYSIKVIAKSQKEIYLDSVSDPIKYSNLTILSAPVMTGKDGNVSFEAVTGCAGYVIEIDGTEYQVDKNVTSVDLAELSGKNIYVTYRMKALGDQKTTADSDWSDYQGQDLSLAEDVIADFDAGYTKLVWNNGKGTEGGMEWYECASFDAAYDAAEGGIKLNLKHGWVCAGIVVKFPTPVKKADIDNLVLRIKLDSNVKMIRIYGFGSQGRVMEFPNLQEGWNELVIPQAKLIETDEVKGMQIIMYTSNNPVNGDSGGKPVTAVLGSIKNLTTEKLGYIPISITRVDANTKPGTLYLILSARTGANSWATFSSTSDTEGVFYNGTKIDVSPQIAWQDNIFCIDHKKTPVEGDTLTVKGMLERKDIKLKVSECTLRYNGTTWEIK